MIDLRNRLKAIQKAIMPDLIPLSVCKSQSGEIMILEGMNVIEPMLDGTFTDIACNDRDIAHLLRSMDTDQTTNIEIICLVNNELIREKI